MPGQRLSLRFFSPPCVEGGAAGGRTVARQVTRPRKLGGRRDPLVLRMKQRNYIETREEHAVIGAHGGDKLGVRLGGEQGVDHRIDGRRLDPGEIERGFLTSTCRAPARALLVAGRGGGKPASDHHIEIEFLPPPLILYFVDEP